MISHPLALTDNQTKIIREHARMIRPAYRAAFLADISDRLLPLDPDDVDDYSVQMAATCALQKFVRVPPP